MKKRRPPSSGRLPFDPSRVAAPPSPPPTTGPSTDDADERPLRVGELSSMIDQALRRGLPGSVRVVGEVSGFRDRTHWWFNLSDGEACIACVMFASATRRAKVRPGDGMEVIVTGGIEHYGPQGRTQLYVTRIEPVGAGAMDQRLRALIEELRSKGYFAPENKKSPPWFPRRVAVVTSKTGAALQDVLSTMQKRCPAVEVAVIDVLVQGPGAVTTVVAALDSISEHREALGIDAIILTRGGGSPEDLAVFNERAIADAIFRCRVPIVAAIGHEVDVTIAELVADERCATPTQAAVRLTPDRAEVAEQLESLARRLRSSARSAAHARRLAVSACAERLLHVKPERVFGARRLALADAEARLTASLRRRRDRIDLAPAARRLDRALTVALERGRDRVQGAARSLDAVGPVRVLARGYSVTFGVDGRVVKSPSQVRGGDRITTRVSEGEFASIVGDDILERPTPKPAPRSEKGKRPHDQTLGLFADGEVR